jgi:hypothetical protein
MKNNHFVISVDGKKKELIGNFKNAGATIYCREAEDVNVYDYPSDAKGKKISDKQMASLRIKRHEIFPNWNYTLLA